MAFTALVSVWRTSAPTYTLLSVQQNAAGTDISIVGEIAPNLKTEMRAVLLQLCADEANLAARANILFDAIDDIVVTDLENNAVTSSATKSVDNRTVSLTISGTITRTKNYLRVTMPQTLVGIYSGTTTNPGDILLQTGVIPGSYTNANITVRADGRISVASNGTGGGGGGSLADGGVTTAKLADAAVTDAKIDSVTAAKVTGLSPVATSGLFSDLTDTISGSQLPSNVVTSVKIADNAVTDAKISSVSASKVTSIPYDFVMDYASGAPALNEVMLEFRAPRAFTLASPASHYPKTLVSGERPASNNGSVLTVYRNSTAVASFSYQSDGTAVAAEPASTDRSFAAGDIFKVVCTTFDSSAKNHKISFLASLS